MFPGSPEEHAPNNLFYHVDGDELWRRPTHTFPCLRARWAHHLAKKENVLSASTSRSEAIYDQDILRVKLRFLHRTAITTSRVS
jgi:hypothetical protein